MNKESDETIFLNLKVRKSDVEQKGIIRVNDKVLSNLGVKEGERIVVSKGEQVVLRKAFGDESVNEDEIFLRPTAREDLDVNEGDIVKVEDYETIGDDVKEKLGDVKEKISKGFSKLKEKFRKKEDE